MQGLNLPESNSKTLGSIPGMWLSRHTGGLSNEEIQGIGWSSLHCLWLYRRVLRSLASCWTRNCSVKTVSQGQSGDSSFQTRKEIILIKSYSMLRRYVDISSKHLVSLFLKVKRPPWTLKEYHSCLIIPVQLAQRLRDIRVVEMNFWAHLLDVKRWIDIDRRLHHSIPIT
jgi:hypothetical protein